MERPLNHLNQYSKKYPNAWKQIEKFRAGRGKDLPLWSPWCFSPMAAWAAIVMQGSQVTISTASEISCLSAIGSWRYSQGIYRFDNDIFEAIYSTPLSREIPVDVLYRLPEWSVYVETPNIFWLGDRLYGFWAHLEQDTKTLRHELRLVLDCEQALIPMPLHIGRWSLEESLEKAMSENLLSAQRILGITLSKTLIHELSKSLEGFLALVLYICCDEPDIIMPEEPGLRPSYPAPTKIKGGERLFSPPKPRVWMVGTVIAETLREASCRETAQRSGGDGVLKKAARETHIRRAHWHGYWKGPRNGDRTYYYKWLPPTLIFGANPILDE
jgi:hypothetical protein